MDAGKLERESALATREREAAGDLSAIAVRSIPVARLAAQARAHVSALAEMRQRINHERRGLLENRVQLGEAAVALKTDAPAHIRSSNKLG